MVSKSEARQKPAVEIEGGLIPSFFHAIIFGMNKDKLKLIVTDLEMLLSALKAEVYSDVESYRYEDIEPTELDYDEEYEGP